MAEPPAARRDVEVLEERIGLGIEDELLALALTHRSYAHEAGGIPTNERLEFLGDAVLGIIVTEALYRAHTQNPEGDLARMRAATVSQRALSHVARELGLGEFILLGRGELMTGGRQKDSILADTLEALIGAAYMCHGLEPTRTMVERLVAPLLAQAASLSAGLDWKTSLQELAARLSLPAPRYLVETTGPDHARTFSAQVLFDDDVTGRGEGTSKKVAEQQAAKAAYDRLQHLEQAPHTEPSA